MMPMCVSVQPFEP